MEAFIGTIQAVAFDIEPQGWLKCDGRALAISQYGSLFALIGNRFGGDGITSFSIPDLRSRLIVGANSSSLPLDDKLTSYQMGFKDGVERVKLQLQDLPPHNHKAILKVSKENANVSQPSIDKSIAAPGTSGSRTTPFTPVNGYNDLAPDTVLHYSSVVTSIEGGYVPHENRQPFLAVHYIICVAGIYPNIE
jgi:microcystin-dependent protein